MPASSKKPRAIVLAGYGLNCEEETKLAFELAGGAADIVHISDLVADRRRLNKYQVMAIPGGFAFGDDTGSGKAYANKLKNNLAEELQAFIGRDTLMIGICNGFQVLTNLGVLPGALLANDSVRYSDRWVDVAVPPAAAKQSPWLAGIKKFSMPIAHGEGKYYADARTLARLKKNGQIGMEYSKGEICRHLDLPANPNGALENIASVTSADGRIIGMMPHPERGMFFTQLPHWTWLAERLRRAGEPLPQEAAGLEIFRNAVKYFNG
jgi:phosphoribosylformylglycinamidine synthase